MKTRQRENIAKYLYDLSKGVILIVIIGGYVSGQHTILNVIVGLITAGGLLSLGVWLDGTESRAN